MKITSAAASRRLARGRILPLLAGGLAVGLVALASGLTAQNNDNGGILPNKGGSTNASNDSILAIDGQLEADFTDAQLPVLRVSVDGLVPVGLAFGVSPDDAEFSSKGTLVAQQLPTGSVELQGDGTLNPGIGLGLTLHAATEMVARGALLVGSDAGQPLDAVLSGAVAPVAVVPMGDLAELDLALFDQLLQKHAAMAVPLRVSVVFVSVDASGGQHLAAVSGLTTGGALDLAFQ